MVDPVGLVRTQIDDGVAVLTMCNVTTNNALSADMVHALEDACARLGADPAARVLLLLGEGETFCSGAPRELLEQLAAGRTAPTDIRLARVLLDLPIPCISALEGHAVGGGLALGLAADVVLMANESRYGLPFMDYGFTPGMGTTRLLEHVLSPAMAHELLYTGEMRRGADFARTGVNYILPRVEVRAKALDLAQRIAEKPRGALEILKRSLSLPRRKIFEETFTLETLMHQLTFSTPEVRRRIGGDHVA
jgi:polyketide biosynthesis enoyl-CoA hydratase PksI